MIYLDQAGLFSGKSGDLYSIDTRF